MKTLVCMDCIYIDTQFHEHFFHARGSINDEVIKVEKEKVEMHYCTNPNLIDLVTGNPRRYMCSDIRFNEDCCGKKGKWFESRED